MPAITKRVQSVSRDQRLLWTAAFFLMFGFGIYSATFFNFATESLKIQPQMMGAVESIRETPGFLCAFVAALSMRIVEPLLASIAVFLIAGGMCALSTVTSPVQLMVWSFLWSVGMHAWMPVCSSLVMSLAQDGNRGKRMGQMVAITGMGAALGMATVLAVEHRLGYPTWFLAGGASAAVGAFTLLWMKRDIGHAGKPRFVWKPRYRLYYVLTFLEGCRKQVFFTFAVYALTKVYHTHLRIIALLFVINNVVNFFGGPVVGRLIDRIGERRILMSSYTAVVLVFIGYATAQSVHWLYVLYCLDNLFYLSTTCLTTYLQKIAEPEDLMPTLSMGVTMNHTAAVVVPLVGGMLWARFSYPVTFFGGAVVAAISLFFASKAAPKRHEAAAS